MSDQAYAATTALSDADDLEPLADDEVSTGPSIEEELDRARSLLGPARTSLPVRIALGQLLYDLRRRGVSQRRQATTLGIAVSRVSMLQRIGSYRS